MGKKDVYSGNLKRYIGSQIEEQERKKYFFGRAMAMDLGSTNTRIFMKGEGIVLDEPTAVAYEKFSKTVLATGVEAKKYLGKTPQNIMVTKPLQGGEVEDLDILKTMVKEFFSRIQKRKRIFKSKLLLCLPVKVSAAEKKIIKMGAREAGIGKVLYIEEPMAAAIGMGLNVAKKKGQMVLDIGGGGVDLSVISNNTIIYNDSEKLGGDAVIQAIQQYVLDKHQLHIGDNSAEQCKLSIAGALDNREELYKISGKDSNTNIPKEVAVEVKDILAAVKESLSGIIAMIKRAFEKMPEELRSDIEQDGIYLTGGGLLLRGLAEFIEEEIKLSCRPVQEPRYGVINGAAEVIRHRRKYKKVIMKK